MKVDLLDPQTEIQYQLHPEKLLEDWGIKQTEWVIVDEIQKNPKLLDVIQMGIVEKKIKFALTGSSSRKIRRGAGNLLGGRAFDFRLHPISAFEIDQKILLENFLAWGSLPEIFSLEPADKPRMLYSYVSTYLKEEILVEQIIRKIEPFRRFLEVAAQMNGKILNYARIGRDARVEEKNVGRYYQILADTLLGFFLEPFHSSIRKRQTQKAKFYFFDTGVTRALQNSLSVDVTSNMGNFGNLFEQMLILEFHRLNDYLEKRFQFSYLRTNDDLEVDLIVERPGQPTVLVEIKSDSKISDELFGNLQKIKSQFRNPLLILISNQNKETFVDGVRCLNWKSAFAEIFEDSSLKTQVY